MHLYTGCVDTRHFIAITEQPFRRACAKGYDKDSMTFQTLSGIECRIKVCLIILIIIMIIIIIILIVPRTIPRKVKATQTFALPVLLHHMWTTDWPIDRLNEIDRRTRQVINDNGCKHRQESLPLFYFPTSKGGKGLTEIETLYKTTKIKLAHYITCGTDPNVELVRTYQGAK